MRLVIRQSNSKKLENLMFWGFLVQATVFSLFCFYISLVELLFRQFERGRVCDVEPWVPWFAVVSFLILYGIGILNIWRRFNTKTVWEGGIIEIGILISIVLIVYCVLDMKHGIGFSDFSFRYKLFIININLLFVAFVIKCSSPPGTISEGFDKNGRPWGRVSKGTPTIAKIIFTIVVIGLIVKLCLAFTLKVPALYITVVGVLILGLLAYVFITAKFSSYISSYESPSEDKTLQVDSKTGMIELTRQNVGLCRKLDIVAISIADPGAIGVEGSVTMVTSDNKVFHTNYLSGISETELFWIAQPFYYLYYFSDLDSKQRSMWHIEYLGRGNNLYVQIKYWDYFEEEIKKRFDEYQEKEKYIILNDIWVVVMQKVLQYMKENGEGKDLLSSMFTE